MGNTRLIRSEDLLLFFLEITMRKIGKYEIKNLLFFKRIPIFGKLIWDKGNIGDEEIMGRYGAGTRNEERSMVVDFGKRMDLAIVNTYFKNKDEHRVTYKSGGKSTQINYVMCRRRNLKKMCYCKVILNECVAKQHRMVVCKMALMVKKKKKEKVKPKIRWWKLKETSCQEAFRQEVTRILGGKDGLPDEWDKTAEMLRKTAETVLGVTFGK